MSTLFAATMATLERSFLPFKHEPASGHRIFSGRGSLCSTRMTLACRGELAEFSSPEALINDAATRMFWRNVKARTTGQAVSLAQATLDLPADKAGRTRFLLSAMLDLGVVALQRLSSLPSAERVRHMVSEMSLAYFIQQG